MSISALALLLLAAPTGTSSCTASPTPLVAVVLDDDPAYDKRLDEAGKDPDKLWELYEWCISTERDREAKSVLKRVVRADPDHKQAREILGHILYEGQWFTTEKKLATYKKKEAERLAKERGWVKYKGEWTDPAHVPFLEKGLVFDVETGEWLTPEEKQRMADGWVRQDLVWVSPDEMPKVEEGLWKVDEDWLSLEEANAHHATLPNFWRIPYGTFVLWATTDREVSEMAAKQMELASRDLERLFGMRPSQTLNVAVLRSQVQYDRFSTGDEELGLLPAHLGDEFVVTRALLAEAFFVEQRGHLEHVGMGACYWDHDKENGDVYGVHAARLAMGHSFVDAIDPSTKAVEKALAAGLGGSFRDEYIAEKKLPAWLRYGAAVYAERYYQDSLVKIGGDTWWTRKWSLGDLTNAGGLRSLEQVFEFRLRPDDRVDARKLMLEAGLLVSFILDSGNEEVGKAHAAMQEALRAGEPKAKVFEKLQKALADNEEQLRTYAGL